MMDMVDFRPAPADVPPGSDLIAAQLAELCEQPGWIQSARSPGVAPENLSPPYGAFVIGWRDEAAVACGGVRRLEPGLAELKRVYIVPSARSQGVARELILALEHAARALGYRRVRMDTSNPKDVTVCRALGYIEIPDYNGNPNALFWGEKALGSERLTDACCRVN
jgi:GNAT superfamily N-acetyltransferase